MRALEGLAASQVRQKAAEQPETAKKRTAKSAELHAACRVQRACSHSIAQLGLLDAELRMRQPELSPLYAVLLLLERLHVFIHLFKPLLSTWLLWAQATSSCQRISSSRSSELDQSTCELGTCRRCLRRSEVAQCEVLRVRQGPSRHDGHATPCAVRPCRGGAPQHLSMPFDVLEHLRVLGNGRCRQACVWLFSASAPEAEEVRAIHGSSFSCLH